MRDKVRLAFIGCGAITRMHLEQGLADFPDIQFVGWCDPNAQAAAQRQEDVGGAGDIFTDAEKMFEQIEADAVYIMLPPFAHGPAENLILEQGLPFFIEKPIALDEAVAESIAARVKEQGLITSVGYMNRYRCSVQRVRQLLDEQQPVFMHGGWIGGGPSGEDDGGWWVQKDKSGGQFAEQTTHTTDLARYLFGEVESVYAVPVYDRQPRHDLYTIEDASMVQLTFANGAAANLYSSCTTPVGGGISLTVFGTQMEAIFTDWAHDVTISLPEGEQITIPGEENIFAKENRAFINSVKAGQAEGILATYEDGLKAVQIAAAADESMQTGQPVKL